MLKIDCFEMKIIWNKLDIWSFSLRYLAVWLSVSTVESDCAKCHLFWLNHCAWWMVNIFHRSFSKNEEDEKERRKIMLLGKANNHNCRVHHRLVMIRENTKLCGIVWPSFITRPNDSTTIIFSTIAGNKLLIVMETSIRFVRVNWNSH